jgi:hypothetical protein
MQFGFADSAGMCSDSRPAQMKAMSSRRRVILIFKGLIK